MIGLRSVFSMMFLIMLLNGCSARVAGHTGQHAHSDNAGLHLSIGIGAAASNVLVGAALLGVLVAGEGYAPAASMKADRTINEQDCSKPIEEPTANLRCR